MTLDILAVCRRPSESILALCKDYEKRLPKNFSLRFTYLAPSSNKQSVEQKKAEEGTRLLKSIPKNCYLICLDSRGSHMTSALLAKKLQVLRDDGRKITIVVGGADGIDERVLSRSDEKWSLSKLTFPHKLVQIILSEQIYRAWSISEGLPYHRG
jgi:23S rRNA (pseudouridine1915-N3)-methyltransferase